MKPISFSFDLPVLLAVLAALCLAGHGAVYQLISLQDPHWSTWPVIAVYGFWILWLWNALYGLTQDRLAASIACFVPSLVPAVVFESLNGVLVLVTVVLLICKFLVLRQRRHADLMILAALGVLAVVLTPPDLPVEMSARDHFMPLILLLPLCILGLVAGWRQPASLVSAVLCLVLVGARLSGFGVSLVPVLFLAPLAAAPAVVYALRELPKKQSFLLWMALPTVMYSLFWIAMMPIRPHFYPFTLTSWAG